MSLAKNSALDPTRFIPLPLVETIKVSHNTSLYRFKLGEDQVSGVHVASCVLTMFTPEGSDTPVIRPYTPTTNETVKGHLDLVVKAYPLGTMSLHISKLKIGETLMFKGPISKFPYTKNLYREIGMIAGGTGITPMLQVIDKALSDPSDNTVIKFLFGNTTEEDILLRSHLDNLAATYPTRFSVVHVISKPADNSWTGETGHINEALIRKYLPSPSEANDVHILVCGPPAMMVSISGDKTPQKEQGPLTGILKQIGFSEKSVFKF
ncbi:NADH-cytochrome b5 reductase 2 [Smittium mucronatum]|uniref:NADH-cytochrome b5 reductase n=1 Tax=Smittium mucronatum TaxID=133383 RepID=A0A1R0H241_9FUNG|nr:NADH-cytochrome b5 reductase 2 [Smittium mucronatum]